MRSRLQTQSCPPNDESSDVDSCLEVDHELVVSCCDAPPILQAAEGAFNNIPALVGNGVEGCMRFRVGLLGMTGCVPRAVRKSRNVSLS